MEIIKVTAEVNSGYNPETANNGGGYFQPSGTATINTAAGEIEVYVDDTSCGEFGSRIQVIVYTGDDPVMLYLGSMESYPDDIIAERMRAIGEATGENAEELVDMAIEAVREAAYQQW